MLQYLDADGTTWKPVTLAAGSSYARTSDGFGDVRFDPVTTRALRIVSQSWGTAEGEGSTGIMEWQVAAAEPAAGPVSVSGTVGSAAGPVAGSCVYLYSSPRRRLGVVRLVHRRRRRLHDPRRRPASYEVAVADPSGGYGTKWRDSPLVVGSTPVTGLDFTLAEEQTGSLVGAVTEQGTGSPLSTICAFAYDDGVHLGGRLRDLHGRDGRLRGSTAMHAGAYDVAFFDPTGRHPTQWWTGTAGRRGLAGRSRSRSPSRPGAARSTADAVLSRSRHRCCLRHGHCTGRRRGRRGVRLPVHERRRPGGVRHLHPAGWHLLAGPGTARQLPRGVRRPLVGVRHAVVDRGARRVGELCRGRACDGGRGRVHGRRGRAACGRGSRRLLGTRPGVAGD